MRYFKIHPAVSCCAYKHGVLHDKEVVHPETQWEEGDALDRVKRGFLIEVKVAEEKEVKETEIEKSDKEQKRFEQFKKRN